MSQLFDNLGSTLDAESYPGNPEEIVNIATVFALVFRIHSSS